MLAVTVIVTGCKDWEADVLVSDYVRVPLAFTFSASPSGSHTRQGSDAVDGANRKVTIQRIVPLVGDTPDGSEVSQENGPYDKPSENPAEKLYYYEFCNMMPGVDHCLVYGEAQAVTGGKTENGSLVTPAFPSVISSKSALQSLSFGLESIYDVTEASADGDAWKLANALTELANVEGWKYSQNAVMQNLYKNFINHEFNLPGSAASVKQWIAALKAAAQSYLETPPSSIGDAENAILEAIKNTTTTDISSITYPQSIGIPDGAAALRWVESEGKFVPQLQTTTLDNINSVSRFAYPAALYYFVNSPLSTSNTKRDYDIIYSNATPSDGKTAWENVLDAYFKDGTFVSTNTKAVALTDPVQYAVARLEVKIQSEASLMDAKETAISVGSSSFPLKGIIVCGQRPVNYLFEQPDNSDAEVKFIYDPVTTTCNLSTTLQEADKMLVLQSGYKEDVDIILEFENNCGVAFKCVDGTVYPGTRFYLIGKIAWNSADDTGKDGINDNYVFTKDYTTTVNMKVTSLEKAYNVLPNLLSSNLEIGVETTPQWVAATPTTIRLDE